MDITVSSFGDFFEIFDLSFIYSKDAVHFKWDLTWT